LVVAVVGFGVRVAVLAGAPARGAVGDGCVLDVGCGAALTSVSREVTVGDASTWAATASLSAVADGRGVALAAPAIAVRGPAFAVCAGAVEGWARTLRSGGSKPSASGATVGVVALRRSASDGRFGSGGRVAYITASGIGDAWVVLVGC
jgi:hypothetical protein